jgi:ABC-type lipoprotein export system ATPase subunit
LLLELHRARRNVLIVVTHNLELAERFQRKYRLADSGLRSAGS